MISQDELDDIKAKLDRNPAWMIDIVDQDQVRRMVETIELLRAASAFKRNSDDVRDWIMFLVLREMDSLDKAYGYPRELSDGEKLKVLVEEVGEVSRAMQDGDRKHLISEYVQVAACAIQQAVIVEQEGDEYVK